MGLYSDFGYKGFWDEKDKKEEDFTNHEEKKKKKDFTNHDGKKKKEKDYTNHATSK